MKRGTSEEEDSRAASILLASAAQQLGSEGEEASQASSSFDAKRMRASESGETITHQQRWDKMFEKLKAYKAKHGNCLVPNRFVEDTQLGSWVSAQRRQYKIVTSGGTESAAMTPDRAKKLQDIGFEWSTTNPRNVPWEARYNELKDFVANYGHAEVPMRWEENPQLSNWVSKQRHQFKLMQSGRPSRLNQKRIKMLDDIGFVWEASRRRLKDGAIEEDGNTSAGNSEPGSPNTKKTKALSGGRKKISKTNNVNDDSLIQTLQQQQMRNIDPAFAHIVQGPSGAADDRSGRVRMDPPAAIGSAISFQNQGGPVQPDPEAYTFPPGMTMGGMSFQNNMEFWAAQQRAAAGMMNPGGVPGQMNPTGMFMPGMNMNAMLPFPGAMNNGMGFQGQPGTVMPLNFEASPGQQQQQQGPTPPTAIVPDTSRPDSFSDGTQGQGENWSGGAAAVSDGGAQDDPTNYSQDL